MDEIIQKIIDFEKEAQAIVSKARAERQEHDETMGAYVKAYREKAAMENRVRIDGYLAKVKKEADESVKHIEDAARLKVVQMQKYAAEHRGEWIDRLYKMIIEGGGSE